MAGERQELLDLRRLAELETRAERAQQIQRPNPVVGGLAEMTGGANRAILSALDFLIPDQVNAALELAGSDKRIPTLTEKLGPVVAPPAGTYLGEGMPADMLSKAGEMAAISLGTGSALRAGAQSLSPLAQAGESAARGTLRMMGNTSAGQDIAAGALGGTGGEIGRHIGGTPGEMLGTMLTPAAPSTMRAAGSEAIRLAARGGEPGRQVVQSAVDDAKRAGTNLTAGQATGRHGLQAAETAARPLIGGGPLERALERSNSDIQRRLAQISDDISTTRGTEAAGRTIKGAISGQGGFVDRFKAQSGVMWRAVDDAIGAETQVGVSNTKGALDNLVRTDDFAKILNTPKIAEIKGAMDARQSVDYATLRELRSAIGARLSDQRLTSDIPTSELRRLYGAISEDIRSAAGAAGDDVLRAFNRANNYTRSGHARLEGFIENVMKKDDFAKVFTAVTKGGAGTQTINAFKRSMKPREWEIVASNVVRELGRASDGAQSAAGDAFSINKFLTDWNRLGVAKQAVFSGSPKLAKYGRDLEAIARTAERVKTASQVGSNSSGTAQMSINVSAGLALGGAALTGNWPVLAGALTAIGLNNASARLMSNPRFVSWLAGTTRFDTKSLASHAARLAAIQQSMSLDDAEAVNSLLRQLGTEQ